MKKYILFTLLFLIILTIIISFTNISLTDYFFILSMIFLTISGILFIIARLELRNFIFKKSKEEENNFKKQFLKSEKIAFYLFIIAIILFIISYKLVEVS